MSGQAHSQQTGIHPASAIHPQGSHPNQSTDATSLLTPLFQADMVLYHEIGDQLQEDISQYAVLNSTLQHIYTAVKENSIEQKFCCISQPVWTIHLIDGFQREVLRIRKGERVDRTAGGMNRKFLQVTVKICPDTIVGYVTIRGTSSKVQLYFYKKSCHNHVYTLRGDTKAKDEHGNCEMMITNMKKDRVAAIARLAPGGMRPDIQKEMMGVKYLPGLDLHDKALMFGGLFLLKNTWDNWWS